MEQTASFGNRVDGIMWAIFRRAMDQKESFRSVGLSYELNDHTEIACGRVAGVRGESVPRCKNRTELGQKVGLQKFSDKRAGEKYPGRAVVVTSFRGLAPMTKNSQSVDGESVLLFGPRSVERIADRCGCGRAFPSWHPFPRTIFHGMKTKLSEAFLINSIVDRLLESGNGGMADRRVY
jgi:hypothetical protein